VGFYQNNTGVVSLQATLLGDYTSVDAIGGSNAFYELGIHVDPPRAGALLTQLQTVLPGQVFVHSYVDLSAQVENYLQNLILVLEILVLPALLAAAANVANAVALSMLDRRRELAIQKALGYTSGDMLGQIILEQGVAALVAGLAAMLLVTVTTLVSGQLIAGQSISRPGASSIPMVVGVVAASVLLGTAVTILVSWSAVYQRPLEALRYQ
jgi:ABC-type antimicrobial peptide transport system permease subunit